MGAKYNPIAELKDHTVMAHYVSVPRNAAAYQSEAQLEAGLIKQLEDQGYEYAKHITGEPELIANLRKQLEALNGFEFTDGEWKRFFEKEIANEELGIEDKTEKIQKGGAIACFVRDSGETKNVRLVDKTTPANNRLQVINQYVPAGGTSKNRYDVTILVNGLPLVHIELKRRGGILREAFNQINRYQTESFWAGKALFGYVQVFVISNGTETRYYSNTTRMERVKEAGKAATPKKKHKKVDCNTWEFTNYWADAANVPILDLEDFARTFLCKTPLLNVLTKYCVFTADRVLLAMRPYQIAATERILQRIDIAVKNKMLGTIGAGGYVWHTTGSGKTLTSFKTAQLAMRTEGVDKVLFVVDRQDLDYQTMKEYDNFCPDCANGSANSAILKQQLLGQGKFKNDGNKIVITTIQKLSNLLKKSGGELAEVLGKNIVLIFDECHRSQFGEMHKLVVKKFKKYAMFGFTGTPIFAANAVKGGAVTTTEQAFGERLHSYTIVDAIQDGNVLKFKVDYVATMKDKGTAGDEQVSSIDTAEAFAAPDRIRNVAEYVLAHYDQKTKRSAGGYVMKQLQNVADVVAKGKAAEPQNKNVKTKGFNALFAVDSVDMARKYYMELAKQMENGGKKLTVATIFTHEANEAEGDFVDVDVDGEDLEDLEPTAKEFLKNVALPRYNKQFGTSYTTDGESFQNYYKDVSLRMKNKEIDLLIVVGMFLTGFDAKTLNTLFVDKNLRMHGLLQAYSRTNRILNTVKDCGQIVCFRNLEKATDESFALFGDKDAKGVVLMRSFADYYEGYTDQNGERHEGYKDIVAQLLAKFPVGGLYGITDPEEKKEFIRLWGAYLRAFNLLTAFDEFCPEKLEDRNAIRIIEEGTVQDYTSWYNTLYDEYRQERENGDGKASILDDVEFEMELVKQVQIDIDYIINLLKDYGKNAKKDKEILLKIRKSIDASPDLRDKRELVERFIESITPGGDVGGKWVEYLEEACDAEIGAIIAEEKLKDKETRDFMAKAFKDGYVETLGTSVAGLLPPMPLFGNLRAEAKARVIGKLQAFFARFAGLILFTGGKKASGKTAAGGVAYPNPEAQFAEAADAR